MKDIPGYEGLYQITENGQIFGVKRQKFLSLREDKDGYLIVNLSKDNKPKTYKVHRLVAMTYLPNPENFSQVNHIDENKKNNDISNLEWCTNEHNQRHGTRDERVSDKLRNSNPRSKKVICIETGQIFVSIREAARQTGISQTCIGDVCRGKQTMTHGLHWKFIEEKGEI